MIGETLTYYRVVIYSLYSDEEMGGYKTINYDWAEKEFERLKALHPNHRIELMQMAQTLLTTTRE